MQFPIFIISKMRCCLVSSPMAVNIFAEAEKFSAKVKTFSFGSMHISLSFKRLNCKQYSIEYWKTFIGKENRDERKAFGKFYSELWESLPRGVHARDKFSRRKKQDSIAKAMLSCKIGIFMGRLFDMHALRVDSVVHQVVVGKLAQHDHGHIRASEMLFIGGIVFGAHVVGKIFGERRVVGF